MRRQNRRREVVATALLGLALMTGGVATAGAATLAQCSTDHTWCYDDCEGGWETNPLERMCKEFCDRDFVDCTTRASDRHGALETDAGPLPTWTGDHALHDDGTTAAQTSPIFPDGGVGGLHGVGDAR